MRGAFCGAEVKIFDRSAHETNNNKFLPMGICCKYPPINELLCIRSLQAEQQNPLADIPQQVHYIHLLEHFLSLDSE